MSIYLEFCVSYTCKIDVLNSSQWLPIDRCCLVDWKGWRVSVYILRDRRGDQRRVNGSRLKFLAIGKIGLVPKYTHNPRVLGIVWSSYGEATPTQESPRNKQDQTGKQIPKSSMRNSKTQHGITHRLIRRTDLNSVGSTDEQSLQQRETITGWSDVVINSASVELVLVHTGWSDKIKSNHRCSCPEGLQNDLQCTS